MENRTFDIYSRISIPTQILTNFYANPEQKQKTEKREKREGEKDKSKTISFRGSSPIVFHDLGRGRCETDGRRKRTEEKRKLVSQRYLNTVYNTDKNKEKKIEI